MYLEMAGGNAEMAVNLFLSMQGDGGGGAGSSGSSKPDLGWKVPDWYTVIWPEMKNIPEAWLKQGFSFDEKFPLGIVQPKNGPCGVLAAVQAVLISQCRKKKEFSSQFKPSAQCLVDAVAAILRQSLKDKAEGTPAIVCTWKDGKVGNEVNEHKASSNKDLEKIIMDNIKDFQGPGGCVLIVYSAALTRGIEQIKKDVISEGGESGYSLTIKAHGHWLCTSELVSLLIRGKAGGNVGAYTQLGGAPHNWDMKLGVGLLTAQEFTNGTVVCDALKSPSSPVWLLHGGDHFTTLWSEDDLKDGKGETYQLYHWNGLPPGGPRLSKITVKASYGAAGPAPKKQQQTYFKPLPGEIESVIQAHPEDRKARPDKFKTWRWEVVLAVEDPSVKGAERPKNYPSEPIFEQGPPPTGPWRCRLCYANRFKTMHFKLNSAGTTKCEGPCGKDMKDCGWSIWMNFDSLPKSQQGVINRREAPKIKNILWTKWPGADITWEKDPDFQESPPSA